MAGEVVLRWPNTDNAEDCHAVAPSLIQSMNTDLYVLSTTAYAHIESLIQPICEAIKKGSPVSAPDFGKLGWDADSLQDNQGMMCVAKDRNAVLLLDVGNSELQVLMVKVWRGQGSEEVKNTNAFFDALFPENASSATKAVFGLTKVEPIGGRGSKKMFGQMYAYGCGLIPGEGYLPMAYGTRGALPNAPLHDVVSAATRSLLQAEKTYAPRASQARTNAARRSDPLNEFGFIHHGVTAVTGTKAFGIVGHIDGSSDGSLELVRLMCRDPRKLNWAFFVAPLVLELGTEMDDMVDVYIASKALHGTLPAKLGGRVLNEHSNFGMAAYYKGAVGARIKKLVNEGKAYAPRVAHVFWHNCNPDLVSLPSLELAGICSAAKVFNTVVLWGWNKPNNLPDAVVFMNAENHLPHLLAVHMMTANHVPVQHIADVVRIRAAVHHGGWVVDCDTLWLKPPPSIITISTVWQKLKGSRIPPKDPAWTSKCKDKSKATKCGWDGYGLVNTPFSMQAGQIGHSFTRSLRQVTDDFVADYGLTNNQFSVDRSWNVIMHKVKDAVAEHEMHEYVRPPIEFGVSPYWPPHDLHILQEPCGNNIFMGKVEKHGITFPDYHEIMQRAFCVPTSFTFRKSPSAKTFNEWVQEAPNSLLALAYNASQNIPSFTNVQQPFEGVCCASCEHSTLV